MDSFRQHDLIDLLHIVALTCVIDQNGWNKEKICFNIPKVHFSELVS